ncbi:MAG: hypothetical protein HRT72_06095, partial [Flavobacteriales bacterium]|nr:hypothetical protein [Flavobacteriales bacterium]
MKKYILIAILGISLFSILNLSAQTIQLPVEVIGSDYTVVPRTFNLTSGAAATEVWMQVNNLSYDDKASIRINGGPWFTITNANVNMAEPELSFGGIGGEISTVRFSVPMSGFVTGANTIDFRFNEHDGLSMGYRVVRFNVLDAGGSNLIPANDFYFDDPDSWTAPIAGAAAIANGQVLWETANLVFPGTPTIMNAKCMDCHVKSGFDLEYFSYSNLSIIERSKFHGLNQTEAEEIASYIRSLSTGRPGRPWNPPYQPGAELDGAPIEEWAAGAGLDAVLDNDTDMEPYLFPNGTSQAEVDAVVDFDSYLDVTELPIAMQFPDWKSWLPVIHPKDLWPTNYFESGIAEAEYQSVISTLGSSDIATLISSGNVIPLIDDFQAVVKDWIDLGEYGVRARTDHWGVLTGTTVDDRNAQYGLEFTKTNYSKWMVVKFFEFMHDYDLEYMAHLEPAVGLLDPVEGTRQWPGTDRTVFEVAPHFTSSNTLNFNWQPLREGKYMSSVWYQLQMTIQAGEYEQLHKGGPMDWSYHFLHINDMLYTGGPAEGFRYITSLMKLWQSRSNTFVPNDFELGWRMRYVHLWWMFSTDQGDETAMESLNSNDAGLRVKMYNSIIENWVTEVNKHDLNTWPRSLNSWTDLEPESYTPSAANVAFTNGLVFSGSSQYHADFFYILIPMLDELCVDPVILQSLVDWCDAAWPLGNWQGMVGANCGNNVLNTLDAAFVSQTTPTTMLPGEVLPVTIIMENNGLTDWTKTPGCHKIRAENPAGNATWGLTVVNLDNADVITTGQQKTFSFNITAPLTPGHYDFRWRMTEKCGGAGNFGVMTPNIIIEVADVQTAVSSQPSSVSDCLGANVTFNITATGTNLTYQWQKDEVDIVGAVATSYSINGIAANDVANYSCMVSGANGIVSSDFAALSLGGMLITGQPMGATQCAGTDITFSTTATGGGLTYQWQKDGQDINGATSTSYSITGLVVGDAGSYTCDVSSGCGTTSSAAAVLAVNAATTITGDPSSATQCDGTDVTFNTTAIGGNLTYQWQKDGQDISGATSASYAIIGIVSGDAGSYTCDVAGDCGNATSGSAVLVLDDAIIITGDPNSATQCAGTDVIFNTTATGTNLTYQWQKDSQDISGATSASYAIIGIVSGDAGSYTCDVAGDCGNAT